MAQINKEKCRNRVLDTLRAVGSMTVEQAMALNENNAISYGIIKEMVRNGECFFIGDNKSAIAVNPRMRYNNGLYEALNLVIPFSRTIRLSGLYLPYMEVDDEGRPVPKKERKHKPKPGDAKVYFSRGKKQYSVTVIKSPKDLPYIASRYKKIYDEAMEEAEVSTRFIIGFYGNREDRAMEFIDAMPDVDFPYAFAEITPQEEGLPSISFIASEDLNMDEELEETDEDQE